MAEYVYVESSGVVIPDTADTLAQVQQEYKDAFGQDLNVDQGPQQVLIAAETAQRQAVARNNVLLANQINPELAGGIFLDAIWRLTGGGRRAGTRAYLETVNLGGQAGTLIPAGSFAQTAGGFQFYSAADVTLDGTGAGSVAFYAAGFGPSYVAGVGALNQVVSAVLGWETVTNPTAATAGTNDETDVASRQRRRNTLALQGVSLAEAITSGLNDTDGVTSLTFRENPDSIAHVIDGIAMDPHSMYACVAGGTDADVAASILGNRSTGCKMMGATTVNVVDPASGQTYVVHFDRPDLIAMMVRVTAKNLTAVGDPSTLIRDALLDYVAGEIDGERGFVVGGSVSPFELAGAINRQAPGLYVQKLEVAYQSGGGYFTTELPIALDELATLAAGSITVNLL